MLPRPPSSTLFPYTTLFRSAWVMLVLNLPFKALMFLTLMRPSLVLNIRALRSEERFSRNAETDLVCRLLLEKKKTQRRRGLPARHRRVSPRIAGATCGAGPA